MAPAGEETACGGWRLWARRLVEHPAWDLVFGLLTLVAVFGFPAYTLYAPAGLGSPAYLATVGVLVVAFALDCLLRLVAHGKRYATSFLFWVDALATVSLLAELPAVLYATQSESGAWPNPRVLRMSIYVTRLSRLARQSRVMLRLREALQRRRRERSETAAERSATSVQNELESRFTSLVAIFVVLGLLFIPLRELVTGRDELRDELRLLSQTPAGELLRGQERRLRSDPRVVLLADGSSSAEQARDEAERRGIAPYELGRYQEGDRVLWISHREDRLAGARLDITLAFVIIVVMVAMSAAFTRTTDRVLLRPLRQLKHSIEEAVRRNESLRFLRQIEASEPVTFLQRAFIPLVERLVAAVNSETRESILSADGGPAARSHDWTVALTDIQGFTTLMETLGQDGFTAINAYFRHCAGVVAEHGGDIFEHTGDGFIITVEGEGKEGRAFAMGVRVVKELERITASEQWRSLLSVPAWTEGPLRHIRTRIGIHSGVVTTGRLGTDRICRYGLIGEAANVAARLESANKQFGTWLLATETVAARAPEELREHTRHIDRVIVLGTKTPVSLYTYDFAPPKSYAEFRAQFDVGMAAYLSGDWAAAKEKLSRAQELWREDGVCAALLQRLAELGPAAPAQWPGAFKMGKK